MIKQPKIAVVGLGYVGLTIASAFSNVFPVFGFDIDSTRIRELKKFYDRNGEFTFDELKQKNITYLHQSRSLSKANIFIMTVSTLLGSNFQPNLSILKNATMMIGKYLKKNDIVIYESTVYPGVTENICAPLLENISGLKYKKDFFIAYSPERINPTDKEHTLACVPKIIAASDKQTLRKVSFLYKAIINAEIFPMTSIGAAEATKLVENTQRDINISLMNEFSIILNTLNLDSAEIFIAAATKWNFLPFKPGLVGGHCVGVNSAFLSYKAEQMGYLPDVIYAGRRINDYMPKYIAEQTVKKLIGLGINIHRAKVGILGLAYKENCSNVQDSKIFELIHQLQCYHIKVSAHDPLVKSRDLKKIFPITNTHFSKMRALDALIIAVPHSPFLKISASIYKRLLKTKSLIVDIKGILNPRMFSQTKIMLWRLG